MMWWCEGVRELFMNGLLGEAEEERVTLVYSLSARLRIRMETLRERKLTKFSLL